MSCVEWRPAREPTEREREIYAAFVEEGSVPKTAFRFGCERAEVELALIFCKWHRQDTYQNRYELAIREGFSQADARLHAEMEAARIG